MGYLYRPKLKRDPGTPSEEARCSRILWCKYYVNGRAVRESTGTDKEQEARRFLKAREGAVATGQPVLPRVDRIRYEEVAGDLRQHYETTASRSLLERRHVDLEAGTLRLDPGMSKNDDGRLVYFPPDLKAQLSAQVERVRALERESGRIIPSLFPRLRGRRRGQPIRDFRKRWATACRKAGVPGMLRHDFRRTAVRNLVNAGVPERVAMTVTGHKTRAVFDRYHIVSPGDLKDVAQKLARSSALGMVQ